MRFSIPGAEIQDDYSPGSGRKNVPILSFLTSFTDADMLLPKEWHLATPGVPTTSSFAAA